MWGVGGCSTLRRRKRYVHARWSRLYNDYQGWQGDISFSSCFMCYDLGPMRATLCDEDDECGKLIDLLHFQDHEEPAASQPGHQNPGTRTHTALHAISVGYVQYSPGFHLSSSFQHVKIHNAPGVQDNRIAASHTLCC